MIDWTQFTPWLLLTGGVLIGLAAGGLMLLCGRIAGISGILGGLLRPRMGEIGWRVAFLAGLLVAPWLWGAFAALPVHIIGTPWWMLLPAGLLVGFGTRLGSGGTSGHGVCGLARLSPRSLAAVVSFMAAGFLTVFAVRHVLGA